MRKKVLRSNIDLDTKLSRKFMPGDALKFKLAVATRSIEKKEKRNLFANFIKQQIKNDLD